MSICSTADSLAEERLALRRRKLLARGDPALFPAECPEWGAILRQKYCAGRTGPGEAGADTFRSRGNVFCQADRWFQPRCSYALKAQGEERGGERGEHSQSRYGGAVRPEVPGHEALTAPAGRCWHLAISIGGVASQAVIVETEDEVRRFIEVFRFASVKECAGGCVVSRRSSDWFG